MKILIGFATFFVFMGIGLGIAELTGHFLTILPPYILFIICTLYFCKKWDRYVISRQAKKRNVSLFEFIKNRLPEYIIHHCMRLSPDKKALKKFLRECVRRELLNSASAEIVLEEFLVDKPYNIKERQTPENTYRNF